MGVGAHVCALGPEGACVHAAVGERTVAPPVFRAFGRRRAFASARNSCVSFEALNPSFLINPRRCLRTTFRWRATLNIGRHHPLQITSEGVLS